MRSVHWRPEKDEKMSTGERMGAWFALFIAFSIGVWVGSYL